MERLGWRQLAAVFGVVGTVSLIGLRWWTTRGNTAPEVPVSLIVLLLVLSAVVVGLGLRVRRSVQSHELDDPIGATRVLVLGQAAAITGAVHLGWFVALLLTLLPHLEAPQPREQAFAAGAAIVVGGVFVAAGLVTQWCCRVPPEDDDDPAGRPPPPTPG